MVFHQCVFEHDFLGHILLVNIKSVWKIVQKNKNKKHIKVHMDVMQYLLQIFFHIPDDRTCKVYPQYVIVHVPFQEKQMTFELQSQ